MLLKKTLNERFHSRCSVNQYSVLDLITSLAEKWGPLPSIHLTTYRQWWWIWNHLGKRYRPNKAPRLLILIKAVTRGTSSQATWIWGWEAVYKPPLWVTSHVRLLCCNDQLMSLWLCVTNNLFLHLLPSGSQEICPHSLCMQGVDCWSDLPEFYWVQNLLKTLLDIRLYSPQLDLLFSFFL
jgi:hypothetical protein